MTITTLLLLLFVTVFFQVTEERRQNAAIYIGLVWSADIFFSHLSSESYFIVMALFNSLILISFRFFVKETALGVRLSIVSLLSIFTNAVGLALWWNYDSPTTYVNMFIMLYGTAIVSLLKQDDSDVRQLGNSQRRSLWSIFSRDHSSRVILSSSNKGAL